MTWRCALALALLGVLLACQSPNPAMSGRLSAPSDLLLYHGCTQANPACDRATEAQPLLLISDSLGEELRVFDVSQRTFFTAPDALFPLAIPVGARPKAVAIDPLQQYAFAANAEAGNVSLVDLATSRLVEIDTDQDSSTCSSDLNPKSDRCRAGVSRVSLGGGTALLPEDIAVPKGVVPPEGGDPWDRTQPLPVYVSLSGAGQVAVLRFSYPSTVPVLPQRLELVTNLGVGGVPSGMAITQDGQSLFVADEASDSIVVVKAADLSFSRVPVGGPSRRLALTPDESVLYVVRTDASVIALVDTATLALRAPGSARVEAIDPFHNPEGIWIPDLPRSLTFVNGVGVTVGDGKGGTRDYTTELLTADELAAAQAKDPDFAEHVVTTFAYVSDMDGNIYLIDAENHRAVDSSPMTGPVISVAPSLTLGGTTVDNQSLLDCLNNPNCPYPQIAEFDKVFGTSGETRPIYYGVLLKPGITVTAPWIFTWQGKLAGAEQSTTGHFVGWRLEDDRVGLDFQKADVRPGDIVEILSSPASPPEGADDPCRPGYPPDEGQYVLAQLTVTLVEPKYLQLTPVDGMDPGLCWKEALRYDVRASGAWTVITQTPDGIRQDLPRVANIPCQADPPASPAYDNGQIALTFYDPCPDQDGNLPEIPTDSTWMFSADSGYYPEEYAPAIRAGSAGEMVSVDLDPTSTSGSPGDDRVYLLFQSSNAMMEFFPDQFDPSNYILYQ